MIKECSEDVPTHFGRGYAEWIGGIAEEAVVRCKFVETTIGDLHKLELLEVGVRVPPTATLIEPNSISEHLPERLLCILKIEPPQLWLLEPFTPQLNILLIKAERLLLGCSERITPKPRIARCIQRSKK